MMDPEDNLRGAERRFGDGYATLGVLTSLASYMPLQRSIVAML